MNDKEKIGYIVVKIGKIFLIMISLFLSVTEMIWHTMIHSKNEEAVIVGLFLFLLMIWIMWLIVPLFFIGVMAGIIFAFLLVAGKEIEKVLK